MAVISTLLGVRQQFIKESGRFDLATTTTNPYDTDAGADYYIRAGQRWLDLKQDTMMTPKEHQETYAAGSYTIKFKHAFSISQVYFLNSDSEKVILNFKRYDEMIEDYPELSGETQGEPAYWGYNIIRRVPDQVASGEDADYTGIITMPPSDGAYTIYVYGDFSSNVLDDNTDESFWTVQFPDLLIKAALMKLEGSYRNTQGEADYRRQLLDALRDIDKALVETELASGREMIG